MDDSDIDEFDKFLKRNWGIEGKRFSPDELEKEENDIFAKKTSAKIAEPKKRGRKPKSKQV